MPNSDNVAAKLHHALSVLELPVMVSWEEIKDRYRELSKKYHPDFNHKEDKMRELNEAYALLKHYIFHYRLIEQHNKIINFDKCFLQPLLCISLHLMSQTIPQNNQVKTKNYKHSC